MVNAPPVGVLPPSFVLKAPNEKYLRRWADFIRVLDDNKGSEHNVFRAELKLPLVSIKTSGNWCWNYDPDWIKANAADNSRDTTWFRVIQVAPDKVAFLCTQNTSFIADITLDKKKNALNATSPFIDESWNVYTVEPAIRSKEIENVKYQFSEKKEIIDSPVLGGKIVVSHFGSKVALTVNRSVSYTSSKERSWSTASTFTESVKMSASAPFLDKIGLEAGFSLSGSHSDVQETAKAYTTVMKDETAVSLSVKPQHVTTAYFLLYKGSLQVPFTYDETLQHFDGRVEENKGKRGVYQATEAGVAADWKIDVDPLPKSVLEKVAGVVEEVAEAGVEVAEAGVEVAEAGVSGVVKTASAGATGIAKTVSTGATGIAKTAGKALGSLGGIHFGL